jgi:hypothetical protein
VGVEQNLVSIGICRTERNAANLTLPLDFGGQLMGGVISSWYCASGVCNMAPVLAGETWENICPAAQMELGLMIHTNSGATQQQ